jgi:hypothetical protein
MSDHDNDCPVHGDCHCGGTVVYLALDAGLRFISARSEDRLELARADAQERGGIVVRVPVISDYRRSGV